MGPQRATTLDKFASRVYNVNRSLKEEYRKVILREE